MTNPTKKGVRSRFSALYTLDADEVENGTTIVNLLGVLFQKGEFLKKRERDNLLGEKLQSSGSTMQGSHSLKVVGHGIATGPGLEVCVNNHGVFYERPSLALGSSSKNVIPFSTRFV